MRTLPFTVTIGVTVFAVSFAILMRSEAEFRPPKEPERLLAIGKTDTLPTALKTAFSADGDFFEAIAKPGPSDWLARQEENGQTFDAFLKSRRNKPDKKRDTIYLQPLGTFDAVKGYPSLDQMTEYTRAFYAMKVKRLPTQPVGKLAATSRMNNGTRQWLTHDILRSLAKQVPADAFCVLAVTMHDLYPDPAWNYVFGMASLSERVGVFSFARHDPSFYLGKRQAGWELVMLERNCKVLAHEIGHMFGIKHCIYFECLMNGSNHLNESDSNPLHLCPCCLRKLHNSIGFEPYKRYRGLRKFLSTNGLTAEADWHSKRLKQLDGKSF